MYRITPEKIELWENKKKIKKLIKALRDENMDIRSWAADALGYIGDSKAIEPLINTLNDTNETVRRSAADALVNINDTKSISLLFDFLRNNIFKKNTESMCENVKRVLSEIVDSNAIEFLISTLQDENNQIRFFSQTLLYKIVDHTAEEPLKKFLKNREIHGIYREYAIPLLEKVMGIRSIEIFIDALKDPDMSVRCSAARVLGNIRDIRATKALIDALKDPESNVGVANNASESLIKLGDPKMVEPMIAILKDTKLEERVRNIALGILVKVKDEHSIKALVESLDYLNGEIQRNAAFALGKMHNPRALNSLQRIIRDSNLHCSVRNSAVRILRNFGNSYVRETLLEILTDKDSSVRSNAAEILGEIGDSIAIEPLIIALKDKVSSVRSCAAKSIGKIGDTQTVVTLIETLNDESRNVRCAVVEALGEIGDSQAVTPLIELLKDKNEDKNVRLCVIEALSKLGGKETVKRLIITLRDQDSKIRNAAINALGIIGDVRAISPLMELMSHYYSIQVQETATKALLRISSSHRIEPLLEYFNKASIPVCNPWDVLKVLADTSDVKAYPIIISYLFSKPVSFRDHKDSRPSFLNIFGDYANLIYDLISCDRSLYQKCDDYSKKNHVLYSYSLDKNRHALEKLCSLDTPVSSNILHLVTKIKEPNSSLSMEMHRQTAFNELKKRGDPIYDESLFLDINAWTI